MTTPTTIPSTPAIAMGSGINTFTGAVLPTAISPTPASTVNSLGLSSQLFVKICDSVESFNKASSLSGGLTLLPSENEEESGEGSGGESSSAGSNLGLSTETTGTNAGFTVGSANTLNINDTSISVMVYAKVETTNEVYGSCSLAVGVPASKDESLAFYQQYGDSYVAGLTEGGEYTAVFVFYCQTKQDQKSLLVSLSANGVLEINGIKQGEVSVGTGQSVEIDASASLSGGLVKTFTTSNIRCSIYQTLLGSSQTVPAFTGDPQGFVGDIVNFAQNFAASTPNQPVVIGYETQGYETLFGDTLSPGFQAIAGNRGIYLGSVGPDLIALQTMQNKFQWLQNAYSTYGYAGDTALATNYTQLTSDIAGLTNWLNTGSWNTAMFLVNAASGGIAQVEFNGQLVMAFIGEYQQITLCASSDGGHTWSYPTILTGLCSNFPPALAVCDNQLYLAYTGLDNQVYRCNASTGFNFSTPSQYGGSSLSGPSLAVGLTLSKGKETGSTVYVAYTDPTGQICVKWRNGVLETGYYTVVGISPALATVGKTLYLAFSTTSPTAGVGNCLGYCSTTVPSSLNNPPANFGPVTYVNTSGPVGGSLSLVGMQFNLYANIDTPSILYAAWSDNGAIKLWNQATNNSTTAASNAALPSLAVCGNALMLAYIPAVTVGRSAQVAMQALTMPTSIESLLDGSGGIDLVEFNGLHIMAFIGAYRQITVCSSTDNGQTWGSATMLSRVCSDSPPTLAVFNGLLYLAFTGLDNNLRLCTSSNGVDFSTPSAIGTCTSQAGPALAVASGALYLAYASNTASSNGGYPLELGKLALTAKAATITPVTLPGGYAADSIQQGPGLAVAGGSLWLAFLGSDGTTGEPCLTYGSASVSATGIGSFNSPTPVSASSGANLANLSLASLFGNLYATWSDGGQTMLWNAAFNFCSESVSGGLPALTTTTDGELLLAYTAVGANGLAQIDLTTIDVSYPFTIPANASGGLSPVVTFNDKWFVAYIGAYQQITLRASSDSGQNWGKPMVLKDMASNYPPTLAAYNGQLCLAYTGLNNTIYTTASSDGVNFLNPPVQFYQTANPTQPNTSYAAPSLAMANGLLYLAFTGIDRQVNVASASDGINFANQILTGYFSSSTSINPALAALGGSLWAAYAVASSTASGNSLGFISAALDTSPLAFSTPQNAQYVQSDTIGGYLSLVSFSGNLCATWQTPDGIVGWNSLTNSCSAALSGNLPALAVCGSLLLLAYAPDAAGNAEQSVSFATMAAPSLTSTSWTSTAYPLMTPGLGGYAQVEFNGQQVMALLGEGGQIYLSSSPDGHNWSNLTAPANACSNFPPTLAVFNNQLVLAFTSNGSGGLFNTGLYSCYYSTGASFSAPVQVGVTGAAGAILGGPALAVAGGVLYLGFFGSDQQLNLASSANGTSFGTPQTLGFYATIGANPGLAASAASLYFGFAANSSCYASAPSASTSPDSLALFRAPIQSSGGIGSFGTTPTLVTAAISGNLSLTVFGNNVYAAWQNGSETWLWDQFSNSCASLNISVQQPVLNTANGELALACGKPQPMLNFSTLSGGVWGAAATVSASTAGGVAVPALASNGGYALAEFNGALYMAYVGASNQIYVCSSSDNGQTWGAATAITNAYSNFPPALAVFNNQLVLAFNNNNVGDSPSILPSNNLCTCYSSTGASFSNPVSCVSFTVESQFGPTLAVAGGMLYLGCTGWSGRLVLLSSSNCTNFSNSAGHLGAIYPVNGASPSLAATDTTLYLGFAADSSQYTSPPGSATPDSLAVLSAPILPSGGIGRFGTPQFYTDTISGYLSLAALSGVLYASWADGGNIIRWCQTGGVFNSVMVVGIQPTLAAVGGNLALVYNTTTANGANQTMLMTMPALAASNPAYLPGSGAAAASGLFALVEFNSQVVMAFADGNGQMFTAASSDGTNCGSPSALTGSSSNNTPALAVFNSHLYLAYTGTDDNVYVCTTSDGSTFGAPAQIAGAASHGLAGPSLAAVGGVLTLFFTQPNLTIWMVKSSNGSTWGTPVQLPSGYIASTPNVANTAVAVYQDNVYLAFSAYLTNGYHLGIGHANVWAEGGEGPFGTPSYYQTGLVGSSLSMAATTDNGLCIAWQQPNGQAVVWSDANNSNSAFSVAASSPPVLAVVNSQLLLAYATPQPNPSLISLRAAWSPSWNAPSFGLWNVPGYNIVQSTCSALTVFNGQPFMAYTDANNTINVCSSANGGQTWGSPTVLSGLTTGQPPALAVFNQQLVLAYSGSGNTLYVCASGDGISFASLTALNASSAAGPALAVAGNALYLAFTTPPQPSTGNVPLGLLTTSDGVKFSACPALPSGYASSSSGINPALAVSGGNLYLAFAASSTSLGYGSAEIGTSGLASFGTPTNVPVTTVGGYLCLAEQAGSLFASWFSSGNLVVWSQSTGACNNVQTAYSSTATASNGQPALSVWENDLVLTYVSTNGLGSSLNLLPLPIVWNTPWNAPDYPTWSASGFTACSGTAVAAFNNSLAMAFTGTGGQIYLCSSTNGGETWGAAAAITGAVALANTTLALAAFNGQLCLAYAGGSSGNLYTCVSTNGVTFGSPVQHSATSASGPALAVSGGWLYLGCVTTNGGIDLYTSQDFSTFAIANSPTTAQSSSAASGGNVALAVLDDTLYLAYSNSGIGLLSATLSATSPGVGSFGNALPLFAASSTGATPGYVSLAAADQGLYFAWSYGGSVYEGYYEPATGFTSSFNIASGGSQSQTIANGRYVLAYRGGNQPNLILCAGDEWSDPWNLPAYPVWDSTGFNIASSSGFAVAELGSQLILAYTDANNGIHVCTSFDGGETWGNPLSLGLTTPYPPALAAFNGELYLAYTATGGGIFACSTSDGVSFGTPTQIGSNTSQAGPALAAADGWLCLAYTAANGPIHLATSGSGISFGTPVTPFTSASASINPALAVMQGNLYLAFAGASSSAGVNCLNLGCAAIGSTGVGSFGAATAYNNSGAIGGCLSLAASGGNLNAAWELNGNIVTWSQSSSGSTTAVGSGAQPLLGAWSGGELLLAYATPQPAIQSLFGSNTPSALGLSTLSGGVWGTAATVSVSSASGVAVPALASNGGYALAEFNGASYMAYVGASNQIYVCSSSDNGQTWGAATAITNCCSAYPPALAAFNDQLVLAFTALNSKQYSNLANGVLYNCCPLVGGSISNPTQSGASTNYSNAGPALAVADGVLYLAFIGTDQQLNITSSKSGTSFGTQQTLGLYATSGANAALAATDTTLYFGFAAESSSYTSAPSSSTSPDSLAVLSAPILASGGIDSFASTPQFYTTTISGYLSLAALSGVLYASWADGGSIILWCQTADTEVKITGAEPTLAAVGGDFALVYNTTNASNANETMLMTMPALTASNPAYLAGLEMAAASGLFALTEFNGQMVMAFTGSNGQIFTAYSFDGTTWGSPVGLTNASSNNTPALAVFNNQLYLAYTGTDTNHSVNVCTTSNGGAFGSPVQIAGATCNSLAGPSLAAASGVLYLFFTEPNLNIWMVSSSNGSTWGTPAQLPSGYIASTPNVANTAVAVYQDNVYLAFSAYLTNGYHLGIGHANVWAEGGEGPFGTPSYYQTGLVGSSLSMAATTDNGLCIAWQQPNGQAVVWHDDSTSYSAFSVAASSPPALAVVNGELLLAYAVPGQSTGYGIDIQTSYGSVVANPTQQAALPLTLSPPQSLMTGSPVFNYRVPSQPIWGGNGGGPYQDINVGVSGLSATASSSATASLTGSASASFNVSTGDDGDDSSTAPIVPYNVTNPNAPIAVSNLPVIASISLWGGNWMNQIQTSYTSLAGAAQFTHGGSGGGASTPLTLAAGEFISSIDGSSGSYVNQLSFTSTKGQSLSWPTKPNSASNFTWSLPSGTNLLGFQGHSGTYLNQLQAVVIDIQPARWAADSLQPLPYTTVLPVSGIGVGYDSFSSSALPNSALDPNASVVGSQGLQSGSFVKVCTSVESLSQSLTKSSGFSLGIGKFKLGYKKTKTKTIDVTDKSVSVVVVAKVVDASSVYTSCAMTASASAMPLPALLTEYGDAFVSSTVNGGEYVAVFVYDCQSVSEQQSVSRSLTAGMKMDNYQVGPSLSSTLATAQSSTNVNCTCHQSLAGSTSAMPVLAYDPQTDIAALVSFASGFDAAQVNAPVVLSYTTTGYEALLPPASANQTAFQTVVGNRNTYRNTVAPSLSRLYGIWSQVEALQDFYATYDYNGDPEISNPVQPGSKAGQVAAAINGLNQWVNNTIANPLQAQPLAAALNPPACLSNGVPSLAYLTPGNPLWGTSPTTPFQDINLGVPISITNAAFNTDVSGPTAIPLTGMPVLSSISLWGGEYVEQMAVTYVTAKSGPTTFNHGEPGGSEDYALNLQPGEFITMIRGNSGEWVHQLIFSTNLGQTYSFPPNPANGPGVIFWQAGSGEVLVGFQGSSGDDLNQLQPISIRLQPAVWTPPLIVEPVATDGLPVVELGAGFNTFTGGALPNTALAAPTAGTGSQNVQGSGLVCYVCDSFQQLDQVQKGLNFRIGYGKNAVAHQGGHSLKITNTSVSVLIYNNVVASSPNYATAPTLNPAAAGLTPDEFFAAYGDSYVSSAVLGAEYLAMMVYDCQTENQQQSVMNSIKGQFTFESDGVKVTVGANFSKQLKTADSSATMQARIYQWLNGSATALPSISGSAVSGSSQASMTAAINTLVSFAQTPSFTVEGNGAVLGFGLNFGTTGYETLVSAATAFQPIVNNRSTYTTGISAYLGTMSAIRKQMQCIANIYQSFGYSGDSAFASHCQQLNEDTAALQNWVNQVNANPTGSFKYPNPPASVNNGMPSLQYNPPAIAATWGSSGGGAWYDLASSSSANTTNQSNNPSNPANPIPLSEQPVLASITLWGQNGEYLYQIGTSYQTTSGTVQFVHGASSGNASSALNLRAGEFITQINSTSGNYVNQLSFTTNFGQSLTWPTSPQSAKTNPAWQASGGEVLVGFQGTCGSKLDQLSPVCITFNPATWSSV